MEATVQIPLTNGGFTLVDAEDAEWVNRWGWHRGGGDYVKRNATVEERAAGMPALIRLHRALLDAPDGVRVHHVDENPLNNTKHNLDVMDQPAHARHHALNRYEPGLTGIGQKAARGEKHGSAKLTKRQVRAIKALLVFGWASQTEVARLVGVSRLTISSITNGQSWRHV